MIIIFFYRFLVAPVFLKYKKLHVEEIELLSEIENNITILKNSDAITQNYSLLFETYKLVGDDDEELLKTKEEIEKISQSERLKITKSQHSPVTETPEYKQFNIYIECSGSLNQLGSFIFSLSESSMLFNIQRIKIQPEGTRNDKLRAMINLSRIGFPEISKSSVR